jgi:hypothetical protein
MPSARCNLSSASRRGDLRSLAVLVDCVSRVGAAIEEAAIHDWLAVIQVQGAPFLCVVPSKLCIPDVVACVGMRVRKQ